MGLCVCVCAEYLQGGNIFFFFKTPKLKKKLTSMHKSNLQIVSFNMLLILFRSHTHLSGDDGDLRDGGLCKSKQQFGSMSDDASVLLSGTC